MARRDETDELPTDQGLLPVARQRLRGLVSSFPNDLMLRRRLAEMYRLYGEPAEAGRWMLLVPLPVAVWQRPIGPATQGHARQVPAYVAERCGISPRRPWSQMRPGPVRGRSRGLNQ